MPVVACFNPGSNSLKFDLVVTNSSQACACEGERLVSGTVDNIGKDTSIEIANGTETVYSEKLPASDIFTVTRTSLEALDKLTLRPPDFTAVRVVHGGNDFTQAVELSDEVSQKIEACSEMAPLHNPNAIEVIGALREHKRDLRVAVAFDTAFHHSIPEVAWRYPLNLEIADRHNIRKFGFHGLSHRYQLEHYCHLTGTAIENAAIITTHLESGSSVCAIKNGQSIETSMGFTPLEGIMMGTRSGSIDPAILPFLMRHESLSAEEALDLLEKKSGLLGISGKSLDTRVLRKNTDSRSRLALEMYAYRVRATLGSYLAILGEAQAVVFGGGIGENTPEVRRDALEGLRGWGVDVDPAHNFQVMQGDQLLSTPTSKVAVWVIHSDEGLELAHECTQAIS